jgi:hypothetical protein
MFRHFALVTILLTTCIALFADGERRDAIGTEFAAQQQKTNMKLAEGGSLGTNKTDRKVINYGPRGGGVDSGPAAGTPMVNPEGAGQSVVDSDGSHRGARDMDFGRISGGFVAPPGLAELTAGKKSGTSTGPIRKVGKDKGPTQAQREALDLAGQQRSGSATKPN